MDGEFIGLVAVVLIFGIPLSGIWTYHRRKMMELKLRYQSQQVTGNQNLQATVAALREEVRSLRDTTTQYDMSFDTALHRMEQRVESLERRTISQTAEASRNVELPYGRG